MATGQNEGKGPNVPKVQPAAVSSDTQSMPMPMRMQTGPNYAGYYDSPMDVTTPPLMPTEIASGSTRERTLLEYGPRENDPFLREDWIHIRRSPHRVRFNEHVTVDAESTTEAETESFASADFRDEDNWTTLQVPMAMISQDWEANFQCSAVPDTPDKSATTVYEAWEVVAVDDTEMEYTWKRFLGVRFGSRWESMCDGYVHLNALQTFEQGELADMVNSAIRDYEETQPKDGGKKAKSYDQDIANRTYKLQLDIYAKLHRLLSGKTYETNMNPHRQRTWKLVLLRENELSLTVVAPERKRKGIFRRKEERAAAHRWFVVLKGEEIKFSKDGWKRHDRYTNPWFKIDRREMREDRVERRLRRDGGA